MSKLFDICCPKTNTPIHHMGAIWRVCYHNPGQDRISMELIAAKTMENGVVTIILTDGTKLSEEAFTIYCRERWPQEHEQGRNPKNPTLGVKSGSVTPGAKFKPGKEPQ